MLKMWLCRKTCCFVETNDLSVVPANRNLWLHCFDAVSFVTNEHRIVFIGLLEFSSNPPMTQHPVFNQVPHDTQQRWKIRKWWKAWEELNCVTISAVTRRLDQRSLFQWVKSVGPSSHSLTSSAFSRCHARTAEWVFCQSDPCPRFPIWEGQKELLGFSTCCSASGCPGLRRSEIVDFTPILGTSCDGIVHKMRKQLSTPFSCLFRWYYLIQLVVVYKPALSPLSEPLPLPEVRKNFSQTCKQDT